MKPKPSACLGCPLYGTGLGFIPPDRGSPATKLWAWGESGGEVEARLGRGFVGPSGRELRRAEIQAGLKSWNAWSAAEAWPAGQEEVVHLNTVLCRPPGNKFPGVEIARHCMDRHGLGLIPSAVPQLICGANATEALTGFRLNPLKVRGSVVPMLNGDWAITTVHPAHLIRGRDEFGELGKAMDWLKPILALDVRRALALREPLIPKVEYVDRVHDVMDRWRHRREPLLGIDIEGKDGIPGILGLSWLSHDGLVVMTMPWSNHCVALLETMFADGAMPIFHNAAYDVPELQQVGVKAPTQWVDTINLAALYDPDIPKNLQTQVLTHVEGSVAWKNLVSHKYGPDYEEGAVRVCRAMWREVLKRLGRRQPATGREWYYFYNGLDVGWTVLLALAVREKLKKQGRHLYYQQLMGPLQPHLLKLGQRGLPFDPARMERHRIACDRLIRMANGILTAVGSEVLQKRYERAKVAVDLLVAERDAERIVSGKRGAFSKAKALTQARTKLKTREKNLEQGFKFDSSSQAVELFYEHLGLPVVRNRDTGQPTTDDKAIESLLVRLTRKDEEGKPCPTVKPKGSTVEECVRVLRAKGAGKKWATWRRNFLRDATDAGGS